MAAETSAGVAWGIKSGLLGGAFVLLVSIISVLVGFSVVPPAKGHEHEDVARRLAAGLLCSLTLGPFLAFKALEWQPGFLEFWLKIVGQDNLLCAYLGASAPFLALTALPGFWIVAGLMRWFINRKDKDIGEMVGDASKTAKEAL